MDDDKLIVSTKELPRNLLMPSKRGGSTGSKSVLFISFDRRSSIQLAKDCVACKPCKAFSNFTNSSMGTEMDDFDAFGDGTNFLKSSFRGAEDAK